MSSRQQDLDRLLLSLWSEPASFSIAHGYEKVASKFRVTPNEAKRRVHAAIKRNGGDPHTSAGLVRAWKINRRRSMNVTDLQ